MYKHDIDDDIHQTYSDGEETASSLVSDDDLTNLSENVKTLNIDNKHITTQIQTMNDCNYSKMNTYSTQPISNDWNIQQNNLWLQQQQQQATMSDGVFQ